MPRTAKTIRPTSLHLHIPEDIRARVDQLLWSTVEKKIPVSAWQNLVLTLIEQYLAPTAPIRTSLPKSEFTKLYHGLCCIRDLARSQDTNREVALERIARWATAYLEILLEHNPSEARLLDVQSRDSVQAR